MTHQKNGGAAFPVNQHIDRHSDEVITYPDPGMSMRDYFAAHAPITIHDVYASFIRSGKKTYLPRELWQTLAEMRGLYADAMIAERARALQWEEEK